MTTDSLVQLATPIAVIASILLQRRADTRAKMQREEVKQDLKKNTEVTKDIQVKVNGSLSVNLRAIAVQARRIAELTNDPHDAAIADAAEKASRDHDAEVEALKGTA